MTGADASAAHSAIRGPVNLSFDELLERVGGDRELLATLAELQMAEAPGALQEIRRFADSGDAEGLERAAHRLVGSLVVFSATEAVEAARALEVLARTRTWAGADRRLADLETEVQRLMRALDAMLETLRS
jgi:HPt (histidine-containing phosphotransfer) domain-containing protein